MAGGKALPGQAPPYNRYMRRFFTLFAVACLCSMSGGCQIAHRLIPHHNKSSDVARNAAHEIAPMGGIPSSSRTYQEAIQMADKMVGTDTSLRVAQVAATGSMRPYLGETSIVILEKPDLEHLNVGALVSFTHEGSEFIHIKSGNIPGGVVTRGSDPKIEERIPNEDITGTALAVIYFDPNTAPVDRSGPPLLLAANMADLPSTAGTFSILDAQMLTGTESDIIYPEAHGKYRVLLHRNDSMNILLGVPGSQIPDVSTQINWTQQSADSAVIYQIYNPSAPETGVVLLYATFGPI